MHIRRDDRDDSLGVNMTPFIDMMFILIIFFLATSRFVEAERDETIRLAKSQSAMPISAPSSLLVINIDRDGRKIVDGRARSMEELEGIVRDRRARANADVVVRADVRGYVGPLAETLEVCHRLGFTTPKITYEAVVE